MIAAGPTPTKPNGPTPTPTPSRGGESMLQEEIGQYTNLYLR